MPIYFSEMLTVKYHKINMNRQIVLCYLFILTLMEVVKTKVTEQGSSHGVQDGLLDVSFGYQEIGGGDISELMDVVGGGGAGGSSGEGGGLSFNPPRLVFGARPLATPHTQRVTVTNLANRTLHLTSISGNTNNFHSSFFQDKVLPPNGNTTFSVVFLGRERGQIFASLLIQTSEGLHKYMITAYSVPSEYRLHPLVGIKLPQNASFSPLIYLHNPHDYMIQITEVYSSGGGVLLELPGRWTEGPQSLWRLTPHSTRPVVAVRCRTHAPHMAYVRIKVDGTDTVLVVAVEVTPNSEPGPYAIPHLVDFGYGGTKDPPKQVQIFMGNSSPQPVKVTGMSTKEGEAGDGGDVKSPVSVEPVGGSWPVTLPPSTEPNTHVATLSINWRESFDLGNFDGKVIIRTNKGQQKIVLPYISQVLEGGLTYSDYVTRYLTCEGGLTGVRLFMIKNEFKIPVYLTDIKIGEGITNYFEVKDFWPQSVDPGQEIDIFKIRLRSWTESLKFESKITLNTNISSVDIPVYIYNGKLDLSLSIKPQSLSPDTLDLGLVGTSGTARAWLWLYNPNPAPVCLRRCGASPSSASLQLIGCTPNPVQDPPPNITVPCSCVSPGWSAVYEVVVVAPAQETTLRGEVWVATAHERLRVPVALAAAHGGRLAHAEPTHFQNCFPGTVCSLSLRVGSTFPVDMSVMSVEGAGVRHSPPPGAMFPLLGARSLSHLGELHLHAPCHTHTVPCYTAMQLNTTVGQQWLSRMSLPADTLEQDANLVNSRYSLYLNLTSKSSYSNLSVKIDTTQVRNHMLTMRVSYVWPRLLGMEGGGGLLEAPLTQVGKATRLVLRLINPSTDHPILAQLAVDWMLTPPTTLLHPRLIPDDCTTSRPCAHSSERLFHFPREANQCLDCSREGSCLDLLLGQCFGQRQLQPAEHCSVESCPRDGASQQGHDWTHGHAVSINPDSCVFLMRPGEERNVTVEFLANYSSRVSSLIYIRNNLTILEVLRVSGQGVIPSLKFGNRKPGSNTPLLFDLTEKHLKDCDRDKTKKSSTPPNLTVKRTFVARNTGEISIRIKKFFINSLECEGYGFKVLNCEPFDLLPNGTYKVEIAFTPDFTLTKVERMLIIETSLNTAVNYSLISSIPAQLVGRCAAILWRPTWEATLNNVTGSLLTCLGILVLIAGFYDSDRILKVASMALVRDKGVVYTPFDLRAIGQTGINKKVETWDCCPVAAEKKQKDPPSFKVSSWNYDDRNFLMEDAKTNSNQNQKYEELTQSVAKSRKKLGKRNSNASDGTGIDTVADTEIPQTKERKNILTKEQQNVNHTTWKNVFARNNSISIKSTTKPVSQGNSSDSSDTVKVVPTTQEATHEKHNKLLEVPKKLSNLFNGSTDSQSTHNTRHVTNNKKHAKTKSCHNHIHQSHSCEEDTSSTTTESSNNDEADKENDNSTSSSNKSVSISGTKNTTTPPSGNKKNKCTVQYKDSYEGDGEDEDYDHKTHSIQNTNERDTNQRWTKNRENVNTAYQSKSHTENDKQKLTDITKNSVNITTSHDTVPNLKPTKKESYKTITNKKDKQPLSKKRSLDKSFIFGTKVEHTPNNVHTSSGFNMTRSSPSTPPAISTVWENKASFSDVVARSDHSLFSHNFNNHAKENETKKNEQKIYPPIQMPKTPLIKSQSNNMYSNADSKKIVDSKPKLSPDLGPIGSNFYIKKSPTSWTDSIADKNLRPFTNTSVPPPIKKPQPQKSPEDMGLMNNNNSFFLSSHSYFSGNSISDLRNPLKMPNHSENNGANAYGTVTSAKNNMNSMELHGMSNSPVMSQQGISNNLRSSNIPSINSLHAMDGGSNYSQMGSSSALSGNLIDIGSGQSLLDSEGDGSQLTGMEAFDSPMPWDGPDDGDMSLLSNPVAAAESMFDIDYSSRNFYTDNKQAPSWTSTSSLWDQSTMGRPGGMPLGSGLQDSQHINSNAGQMQNNTANNMVSSERSPAEWLWGYSSPVTSRGLGAIGSPALRPPPGLAPPPHLAREQSLPTHQQYNAQQQQQQQQQQTQQVLRVFDPFHSLSSIWSPGSSLDRWNSGQQNAQQRNEDHSASHNANQYQ